MSVAAHEDAPPPMMVRSLAVCLVAHNDSLGLSATVERLHRALLVTTEDFEIIVFDDGSTDDTQKICTEVVGRYSNVKVVRFEAQKGAGHCFKTAVAETNATFVVYVPADNTWPYRAYVELFGNIGKADLIVSYSSNLLASLPLWRRLVSRIYGFILNATFRWGLHYYNGLTIFPASFLRSTTLSSPGFGFQAEALIKGLNAGHSFIEIPLPTDSANVVRSRAVNLRNIVDALRTIVRLTVEIRLMRRGDSRRIPLNVVEASQSVDEIGLNGTLARSGVAIGSIANVPPGLRIAITGAGSGIGEALTRHFAGAGHDLFICGRREGPLNEIARQFPSVRAIRCDVTKKDDVAAFVRTIASEIDGLDVLINCAGTFGAIGPIGSIDCADWWETLHTNLFGSYMMVNECLALLERGRKPRIINISGGGAFSPFPNYSAYACSKAALVRLTECLAVELQPKNIRVNAISPGVLATRIHEATIDAGEQRAGRLHFRRTMAIMNEGGPSLDEVIACFCAILSPSFDSLTGKTISSNFDPWRTKAFADNIPDISSSDLYTLRRVNLANLNDGYLRKRLAQAWANFGSGV